MRLYLASRSPRRRELLHQIDDDRLLTESQARDAWEARQADEIAQIAARNAARRAA